MPDSPMPPEAAAPAQAPAEGGGAGDALASLGDGLSSLVEAMGQDQGVPPEAMQAFQASLEAYQAGMAALQGGGGAQPQQGATTPEQGASNAMPESMGRRG